MLGDVLVYSVVTVVVIGLLLVVNEGARYFLALLRKLLDAVR